MPKVTVLITVYNNPRFIGEAVQSVLAQNYNNFEIVLVDDGSDDDTPLVVEKLALADSRIRVFQPGRLGRVRALNYGAAQSNGEYIAVLDSDDVALPSRLSTQAAFLDAHQDIGLIGCGRRELIDREGHVSGQEEMGAYEHEQIRTALLEKNVIFHSSTMYRKKLYDLLGGYDERLACFEDYDFYIRAIPVMRICNLDKVLVRKRIHEARFFFGKKGLASSEKLKSLGIVHFRKVRILHGPPKYLLWSLKAFALAYLGKLRPGANP